MGMRIIHTDGVGLAAMIRAAEKIWEVAEEFNVGLGVVGVEGKTAGIVQAIAVGDRKGGKVLVTVERNPRVIEVEALGDPL